MGIYDRDYTQDNYEQGRGGGMRMALPPLTPMVKRLIIINVAVFFIGLIFFQGIVVVHGIQMTRLEKWFAVLPVSLVNILQVWRLVTYQFLHSGGSHILFNMLGLYFLGPTLEQYWGSKKFIKFYLACGAAGGIFYTIISTTGYLPIGPLVGASGAILGMLAACAILFPHFVVFILFFPVPIRVASIGITILYLANLISKGQNAGGDAAHLAGLAAGAGYVLLQPLRARMKLKKSSDRWQKNLKSRQVFQAEIDRILEKVHVSGIASLTAKEKDFLKQATKDQQIKSQ